MSRLATVTGLVATGVDRPSALPLTPSTTVNVVSTVAAGTGVLLPPAVTGLEVIVVNSGANTLLTYPQAGANLGLGLNTPFSLGTALAATFVSSDGLNWVSTSAETSSSPTFSSLSLTALTNQIVTASASAHPTTLNIPGFAQTTVITVPNPHGATATIPVIDSTGLFWPVHTYDFPGDVNAAAGSFTAGVALNAPIINMTGASNSTIVFNIGGVTPTDLVVPAFTQGTTLAIKDPGVASAQIPTAIALNAGTGVMCDANNNLVPVYPTLLPLPASITAPVRVFNKAVPGTTAFTVLYTNASGTAYTILTAASHYNPSGATAVGNMFTSPDGGTTNYFASQVSVGAGLGIAYPINGIVLQAGWSLVVQGDGNNGGVNQSVNVSFLATALTGNYKAIEAVGLVNGTTVLYTCPVGKQAYIVDGATSFTVGIGPFHVAQQAGAGTLNYIFGVTIPAGSYNLLAVGNGSSVVSTTGSPGINRLNAGDAYYVTAPSTQTTSHVWFQVYEYSALLPEELAPLPPPEELKAALPSPEELAPLPPLEELKATLPLPEELATLPSVREVTGLPPSLPPRPGRANLIVTRAKEPDSPEWTEI
jgi:hypothetical protein